MCTQMVPAVMDRVLSLLEKEEVPLSFAQILESLLSGEPVCQSHLLFALEKLLRQGKVRVPHMGSAEDLGPSELLEQAFVSFSKPWILNGRWKILGPIGRGGMSRVYKAEQISLGGRTVAVKIISVSHPDPAVREEILARGVREAKILASFSHPNIVAILDAGREGGEWYYVMEHLPGGTLEDRRKAKGGRLPWREVLMVAIDVAGALAYANVTKGVLHRDVKPENIMFDAQGNVRVTDFGLAKPSPFAEVAGEAVTKIEAFRGSMAYMAPERWEGAEPAEGSESADTYSFGMMLRYLLTGALPFPFPPGGARLLQWHKHHVDTVPEPLVTAVPDCLREFAEAIDRMIRKRPEDRYRSFKKIEADLRRIASRIPRAATTVIGRPETSVPRPKTRISELRHDPQLAEFLDVLEFDISKVVWDLQEAFGPPGTNPELLRAIWILAHAKKAVPFAAAIWAEAEPGGTVGDFEAAYERTLEALAADQESPEVSSSIPLDLSQLLWLALRMIERDRRDKGAWGNTTALEGLLNFLTAVVADPSLAPFRIASPAHATPVAVPEAEPLPSEAPEPAAPPKPSSRSRMRVPVPAPPPTPPTASDPGSLVGHTIDAYHIQELIGEGGMGTVYLARDLTLDRPVALKVLHARFAKEASFVDRFIREAQLAARLTHPNLVPVYRTGDDGDLLWYVMEYVPSRTTLADHLEKRGRMDLEEILRMALATAQGLHAIHSQDCVHRDIKPDNLMIVPGADGRVSQVKILDAGLLRPVDDPKSITTNKLFLGTPEYASPEQLREEPVDGRSDLYSMGVILYECLAGGESARPYPAKSKTTYLLQTVDPATPPVPLRDRNPQVPEAVARLVHKLLEKNPADRVGSAAELVTAIEQLLADLQESPLRTRDRSPRSVKLLAGAALGSLLALLGGYFLWPFLKKDPGEKPVTFELPNTSTSATKTQSIVPIEKPSAPGGLAGAPLSSSEISLSWLPGARQDHYRVERSDDEGKSWRRLETAVPGAAERFSEGGLSAEREYLYRMLGVNAAGDGPVSGVARVRPQDLPLPIVRLPNPGDLPASPPKEDASSERWFLSHVPTSEELTLIRRSWAILERRDSEIQRGTYAEALAELAALGSDPKRTTYSSYVIQAEAARLASASEIRNAFAQKLQPGTLLDLRLVDGRTVSGTVVAALADALEIRPPDPAGEKIRIARHDIAEESIYAGATLKRQISYRATHGNPHGALAAIARRLGPADSQVLDVDDLAALPGLVHGAALRAAAALEVPDFDLARTVQKDLDDQEKLLPKNLAYALEARAILSYEVRAAEALQKKAYEDVLQNFERTRAYPRALREVHAAFTKKAAAERIDKVELESWKFSPFEQDPEERGRHVYRDFEEKAWVIDQAEGLRRLTRTLDQARNGYAIEWRFDPAPLAPLETSGWVLILTDASKETHVQLTGNRSTLALFDTPPSGQDGKLIASFVQKSAGGYHRLLIVPVGSILLVYADEDLAFRMTPQAGVTLDSTLRIGVSGGALRLKSLKLPRGTDE